MEWLLALALGALLIGVVSNFILSRKAPPSVVVDNLPDGSASADVVQRIQDLAQAVNSSAVQVLSLKRGRTVVRLNNSSFGTTIAKLADADRPQALQGLISEGTILSYLESRGFRHAPRLRGIELLNPQATILFRDEVPGQTLHEKMRAGVLSADWPTVANVLTVCESIGRVVSELHQLNVVHGDLKPANIVLEWTTKGSFGFRGLPALIDFESAQFCRPGAESMTGSRSGTWGFIAPERYLVNDPKKQSDVFSLSAMTWFLFVGRVGLYGSSASDRVPTAVRQFLRESLDIDWYSRPADAGAWMRGMEEARLRVPEAELRARVRWPKSWLPSDDELMSQTLGHALAAGSRRSELIADEWETVNREAMRAVRAAAVSSDIELFLDYLLSNLRLDDYADTHRVARSELRRRFQDTYDTVSRAIAKRSGDDSSNE